MIASVPVSISPTTTTTGDRPMLLRNESSSSSYCRLEVGTARPDSTRSRSSSTSTVSIPFRDSDVEVITLDGLAHADIELKARLA
ncbi:hypothetical protein OE88DRAFT_1651244 [Heliocybe sulcata]|uniref:Uncharacterized protein n=1 Tax=Heliocybe sulcata TaxID=5364 RepID=A0A5C3NKQ8_9AGAM|nr:hypothetical protein OE88DRAFT_1651244 [Heliocybe sulcata]